MCGCVQFQISGGEQNDRLFLLMGEDDDNAI